MINAMNTVSIFMAASIPYNSWEVTQNHLQIICK